MTEVFLHPGTLWAPKGFQCVTLPNDARQRAIFLRDVAPQIEVGVAVGGVGYPADFLVAARALRLVCCFGAGYDAFDVDALRARGVTLTNCPGVNSDDVADVAIGLLVSVVRGIASGDARIRAGGWRDAAQPLPDRIGGRKLGIVGMGAIGEAIARRGLAMGMQIAWTGPRPKPQSPYPRFPTVLELAHWADVLILAARADPGGAKLVDAPAIEALGSRGVLINIARGALVDEGALIAALKSGGLAGAGLDVFESEPTDHIRWRDVPNTTFTPHLGGATSQSIAAMSEVIRENICRYFAGSPVLHAVTQVAAPA